jgi:Na+/H+ antiporter NhaC
MELVLILAALLVVGAVIPLVISKKYKNSLVQFLSKWVGILVTIFVILLLLVIVGVSTGILIP